MELEEKKKSLKSTTDISHMSTLKNIFFLSLSKQ